MRRAPPPLSVTSPPPSSTRDGFLFLTFAVAVIVMVTGAGPQLKVTTPPAATAATTAAEVQLAGVPVPMTRVGWLLSAACASAGTATCPSGFPAWNDGAAEATGVAGTLGLAGAGWAASAAPVGLGPTAGCRAAPQPATASSVAI